MRKCRTMQRRLLPALLTLLLTAVLIRSAVWASSATGGLRRFFSDDGKIAALCSRPGSIRQGWTGFLESLFTEPEASPSPQIEIVVAPDPPEVPEAEPEEKMPEQEVRETVDPSALFDGYLSADSIRIDNETDYSLDLETMLNEAPAVTLTEGKPSVLIIHSHPTEAYMPDGTYRESDPYRTLEEGHNVIGIGTILERRLTDAGIGVIHDKQLYDYPQYSGSYGRALESIESYLTRYPTISIVIDLHRDAIGDTYGPQYTTVAPIGDTTCSQVLLVTGTDEVGLYHPEWRDNLRFALRLQYAMNELYPSLARPIDLTSYRYNQHETPGSMILEVGCTGNTYEESALAVDYFADSLIAVLQSLP